jgi:hypothetical protein
MYLKNVSINNLRRVFVMFQPNMNYQNMQPGVAPVTKFENALKPEEIERLQKKVAQFSIGITEEERLRGICTHRSPDGTHDMLIEDPITKNMRCQICGYEFAPVNSSVTAQDIKDSVQVIQDILQTIKLLYIDLPPEAAREYFQIIPLIDKIPDLFEFAAKNFNKHEVNQWNVNGYNPNTVNMFNNLLNMFGQGPIPTPMPGQQNMGGMNMGMPQGNFMNQPAGMPGYGYGYGYGANPNPAMSNGFGYMGGQPQQPQPQYTPNTAGFSYSAPQNTTPATPTVEQPATPATVVEPATDSVVATVKA